MNSVFTPYRQYVSLTSVTADLNLIMLIRDIYHISMISIFVNKYIKFCRFSLLHLKVLKHLIGVYFFGLDLSINTWKIIHTTNKKASSLSWYFIYSFYGCSTFIVQYIKEMKNTNTNFCLEVQIDKIQVRHLDRDLDQSV